VLQPNSGFDRVRETADTAAARRFFSQLGGTGAIDARHIAVVVAHPDDETIGCGALLRRLDGVSVVVVTDGAPENLADVSAHGFVDRRSYASARIEEFVSVMRSAGVRPENAIQLGITDQRAAFHLSDICVALRRLFSEREISMAITHAYEGGHPDHDAAAFGTHHARQRTREDLAIVEMPYYRAGVAGEEYQTFGDGPPAVVVPLSQEQRALKQQLMDLYVTQKSVLTNFGAPSEHFRPAPRYDFTRLPNGGRLLYERYDWGLSGRQWLACVRAAGIAAMSP
jgi:LmbE family N-acetylglucosaminyl deacetylase